jgi:hypothetical protein
MPVREIAKYQQTFHGTTDDNEFTFQFYRVYKRNQQNKFRVRVVQIADYRAASSTSQPHAYFAQDLTNGTAVYSEEPTTTSTSVVSANPTGMKTNEFCLGVVMPLFFGNTAEPDTAGTTQYLAPEFIVDEISTSPFIVGYRHIGTSAYASGNVGFMVVFEITEIEEVPY